MGKKSKKKAKAVAASTPDSAGAHTGCAVAAIGNTGGKKNARCFECFRTVKISEGKGHQCPGCLHIYCWMCEEKKFAECPNGPRCVHPCRRCQNCTRGRSMLKAMKELGISCEVKAVGIGEGTSTVCESSRASVATFCTAVSNSDKLTHDVMGVVCCRNRSCHRAECRWCLNDKEVHQLLQCVDVWTAK